MSEGAKAVQALRSLEHIKLDGLRFRLIDARGLVVGTLATQISTLLQGKDKPTYSPKRNMGDVVIVINAAHVHFTHDKWATKSYAWHTGWPGGFRERPAVDQWERDPTSILVKAVNGMLPKNRLRPYRMDKLKVFPEADHPFSDLPLVPYVPATKRVQRTGLSWSLPEGLQPMNPEIFAFRAWTGSQRASQPPQQQQQQQPPVAQLLSASSGQAAGLVSPTGNSPSSSSQGGRRQAAGLAPMHAAPAPAAKSLPRTQPSANPAHPHSPSGASVVVGQDQGQQRVGQGGLPTSVQVAAPDPPSKRGQPGSSSRPTSPLPRLPDPAARRGLGAFLELLTEEEKAALLAEENKETGSSSSRSV